MKLTVKGSGMNLFVFLCGGLIVPCLAAANPYAKNGFFVRARHQSLVSAVKTMDAKVQSLEPLLVGEKSGPSLYFVKIRPGADLESVMATMGKQAGVESVTPNYFRKVSQSSGPLAAPSPFPKPIAKPAAPATWTNDPKSNVDAAYISADKIFKMGILGDPKIIIADIDTGADYNHRDLAGNIWHNSGEEGVDANGRDKSNNGIDDDGNGYIDDYIGWDFFRGGNLPYDEEGHGTHTAGIATAVGGNGWGISGVCPRCSLMALKFVGPNGEGSDLDAIHAIEYAVKNGARIMNCSWGGPDASDALKDAFKFADDNGVIAVTSAGNDGLDLNYNNAWPAKYNLPRQLAVAALLYPTERMPWWTNFGSSYIHVSEAGDDVLSTYPGDNFISMSGTSMAAPGISGAVGLIWSYRPNLSALDIKKLIQKHVRPDVDSMQATIFGGRPDLSAIFKELMGSETKGQ